MAMMRKRQPAARQSSQPTYNSQLAQYASAEGFGAGAFNRARAAGFTDAQIKTEVESLRGQGMKIGDRVNIALNPATYGNDMAIRGATEGGFMDMGSGSRYGMRAVMLPEGVTAGGGKGVVWAAGPMTDEQIINQLSGKPRESYVLPAGVNAPGEAYRGPAGTSYIDPSASAADQARMAAGTYGATGSTSTGSTPAGTTAAATPKTGSRLPSKIRDASFLGQAIRVAGERGGTIDRKEMKRIARTQDVSIKDVKERLAIVNEKRAERDKSGYTVESKARDFAKGKAKEVAAKAPVATATGSAANVVTAPGRTVAEKKNDVLKAARKKMGISEEKRADFAQRSAESKKAKAAAAPAQQAPAKETRAAAPARQQAPARQAAGRRRK